MLPCSAMLLSLITGPHSTSPWCSLHPPLHSSTSRHQQLSNILVAWPRQQQPSYLLASLPCCGSLRPAASSRRGLGLCCRSSGRGSRCRWRAAAGCSWCAESCQCVTNSSSAGAACGPGGVRAGTGVQPSHRHHPGRHSAPPHRRAAATCPLYTGHTTVTTQPPAATTPPPRDVDTQCQGHSQEGGHRCLLCPLYSAEPLYCTVQLPGLVAVVQVASPPARQPRYCIIIMVGAAQPQPPPQHQHQQQATLVLCCGVVQPPHHHHTNNNTTAA